MLAWTPARSWLSVPWKCCPTTLNSGCTSGSKSWSANCWWTLSPTWHATVAPSPDERCRFHERGHHHRSTWSRGGGIMTTDERRPVRRALLSVSDKAGLRELAAQLHAAGVQLFSTGSTAAVIADAGVPVTGIEELTGFPECLDGRVKTLHPRVHAGLLADTRKPEHLSQLHALNIAPFELLVVNLYPFEATVVSGAGFAECVEQIDIGGPAMVRAAAKNHASVAVVVDPAAYGDVLDTVRAGGFTL